MMPLKILAFFDCSYQPDDTGLIHQWEKLKTAHQTSRHHFPLNRPATLGYYDLSQEEQGQAVIHWAQNAGINGFVVDVLPKDKGYFHQALPLFQFFNDDFTINFRWRNDLDHQNKGDSIEERINDFTDLLHQSFQDYKSPKELVIIISNPLFSDIAKAISLLRESAKIKQLPDLYLIANRAEDKGRFISAGFDALIDPGPQEWHSCPPNFSSTGLDYLEVMAGLKDSVEYLDRFFSYPRFAVARMVKRELRGPAYPRVFPSFYNWASHLEGGATHLVHHGHKAFDAYLYGLFLENAMLFSWQHFPDQHQFVFLESWNYWLEGSQIEPSYFDGDLVYNATQAAIDRGRYMIRSRQSLPKQERNPLLDEKLKLLFEAIKNIDQ